MTGIICAMQIEGEALKKKIENPTSRKISGLEFTSGRIYGEDVVICTRAFGKVAAGITTEIMILSFGADKIINTGVAGTLTDALGIGDIAISDAALQHDVDTSPIGDPKGFISGIDVILMPADKKLADLAEAGAKSAGVKCRRGVVATGDQFISTDKQRNSIREGFENTVCCEMEGGAVAQAAYMNGVPFVIIRAMSDSASGDAPADFASFTESATENNVKVLEFVLKNLNGAL